MPSSSSLHYRSSPRRRKSSSRDSSPERKRRHGTSSSTTTKHGSGKKHRATDANKESKCATIKRLTQQVQEARQLVATRYKFMAQLAQSGPCRKIIESHARSNTLPFYDLATYVLDMHDNQSAQQMQHTAPQFRSAHSANMQSNMMMPNTMMRGPLATNTGNNQQLGPVVENSRFAADGSQRGFLGRMWYKGKRLVRNNATRLMVTAIMAAVAIFGASFLIPFGFVGAAATATTAATTAAATTAAVAAPVAAATGFSAIGVAQWLAMNTPLVPMIFAKVGQMMPGSSEVQAAKAEIERQSRKPGAISGGGKTSTKKKAVAKVKSTHSMVLRPRRQHSY